MVKNSRFFDKIEFISGIEFMLHPDTRDCLLINNYLRLLGNLKLDSDKLWFRYRTRMS